MTDQGANGGPGADGEDRFYRPWIDGDGGFATARVDGVDDAAAHGVEAMTPARARLGTPSPAASKTDIGTRVAGAGAALAGGWRGFAARTIAMGERIDVPRRVAALELGDKAQRAGEAIASGARQAGSTVADVAGVAARSGADTARRTGTVASRATRKGIEASIAATRTGGSKAGQAIGDAARPIAARIRPPKGETPALGSEVDRMLAQDAAASPPGARTTTDLPLFTDFPAAPVAPSSADAPDATHDPVEPAPPAKRARNRRPPFVAAVSQAEPPKDDARSDGPIRFPATPALAVPGIDRAGLRRAAVPIAIVVALILALLAARAWWPGDARPAPTAVAGDAAGTSDTSADADTASQAALADLDPEQRAAMEAVVEAYLLDHPEIIPRALERLQTRETTGALARLRDRIETPFAGAWAGNAAGDVTVTEYSDYACTFCRASMPDVERLLRDDPKVKLVYRELPILTAQSAPAAKVGLAAARKGRYRIYHQTLFALGQPSETSIAAAASKAGLTPEEIASAKSDPALDREIAGNVEVAQQLRFQGTPSFVIGDQVLHGAVGYDALKQAVAAARKAG